MMQTDISTNTVLCLHCQHISSAHMKTCLTCGEPLHQRKVDSYNRTLYLTLAAIVFYLPSNYFTIMKTQTLTTYEDNTIIQGIFYFFQHGEFFVGTVIFMASVFIPMVKLVILMFLLYSIKTNSTWKLRDKNKLFATIHTIGRWSMLDIFVMGLMISMVHFEGLAMVTLGWASLSFAIMVVLTMFATQSFDTRLLWDTKLK
ncbi:paraquat-inducible protein A [Sulfurimonas sp. MAG313]|nr:paraquat-inducible protein A [Sulfurimonas sp. MAG313]MDF1880818.1 paraquat-inducible protein A [Sulfurimonas sp. MAG313]